MPSTFDPLLRLELQEVGENEDTWGIKANTVFELLAKAVAGHLSIDIGGSGNYTLTTNNGTDDQARYDFITLTGALVGNRTVIIPSSAKSYTFRLTATGPHTVTVKTSGGTGVVLQDGINRIACDGTDCYAIIQGTPATTDYVDAAVSTVQANLATVSALVSANTAQINAVSALVSANTAQIAVVSAQVSNVAATASAIGVVVSSQSAALIVQASAIADLQANVAAVSALVSALDVRVSEVSALVSSAGGSQISFMLQDRKAAGAQGGTFTSGDWRTRDLNTKAWVIGCDVTVASNQFTVNTLGVWRVHALAPALRPNSHRIRLRNITAGSTPILGGSHFSRTPYSSNGDQEFAQLEGVVTVSATATFELQHRGSQTIVSTGFGVPTNFGDEEYYSQITFTKIG